MVSWLLLVLPTVATVRITLYGEDDVLSILLPWGGGVEEQQEEAAWLVLEIISGFDFVCRTHVRYFKVIFQ